MTVNPILLHFFLLSSVITEPRPGEYSIQGVTLQSKCGNSSLTLTLDEHDRSIQGKIAAYQ